MMSSGLNVIALVSGGKDSFFSALHCLENGHRLVALANLHPPGPAPRGASFGGAGETTVGSSVSSGLAGLDPGLTSSTADVLEGGRQVLDFRSGHGGGEEQDETDLNSFMYQTVGHQVIPLYAEATGIPLYRQPIVGGAVQSGRDYSTAKVSAAEGVEDETESLVPLLQSVLAQHPEANALSAGAILSTYQRTRVESVALRLGLTPLAYLWKYPVLPPPSGTGVRDEAQLLLDMAAAGLDARIIKVASGGLDESFLWENVASARGITRLKKAMSRFGSAGLDTGAVLGEGGEFETLVVDGPKRLFKQRVVVGEEDRMVVREGGGTAWAKVRSAKVAGKSAEDCNEEMRVRRPERFDERFCRVAEASMSGFPDTEEDGKTSIDKSDPALHLLPTSQIQTWAMTCPQTSKNLTIAEETTVLVNDIRSRLADNSLSSASILSVVIILRSMADFPSINVIYGSLFTEPNPPSRVTISCGDLLPAGSGNIAIYLTLHADAPAALDRQGLHVQSRSYWAPANIGPYSQAITFPVAVDGAARAVHIAGQIPLEPASMELPAGGTEVQLALSLQHLWRIGAELGVQWWTGATVYFPRADRSRPAVPGWEKARAAWCAWREAHRWSPASSGDDEEESGPDLWDRKFNPLYMSYSGEGDRGSKAPDLPDYSLLADGEDRKTVPFCFAVEVDELPRSAEAEWHAHAGLSGLDSSSDTVQIFRERRRSVSGTCEVEHCLLTSETGAGCLHSVIAVEVTGDRAEGHGELLDEQIREKNKMFGEDLAKMAGKDEQAGQPYLLYVDTDAFTPDQINRALGEGLAVIPCASICGGPKSTRFGVVALYRTFFSAKESP